MAATHPKFARQNRAQKKRVGEAWRKPRGIDNKQRVKLKWAGASPAIGYRSRKSTRGKRDGMFLAVVHNAAEISKIREGTAVYISSTVGEKKKSGLVAAAQKAGIRVLNPAAARLGK
jgi:large subunit ribosomal protein L32e